MANAVMTPATASTRPNIAMGVLLPAWVQRMKPTAATMLGTMMCQRRSRVLSEWRPVSIMTDEREAVGDDGEQADVECVFDAGLADDGGLPEADGVGAHLDAEEDCAEEPDAWAREDGANCMWVLAAASSWISAATRLVRLQESHFASTTRLSRKRKMTTPRRIAGMASRMKSHCHPAMPWLPAKWRRMKPESGPPMMPETGIAGHQQGNHCGAAMEREPVGEVEDHAGEESGFGNAQQQACGVELHGCADQRGERGDDAPGDDDAADPDARADLVQHDVAGDFEGEVAEEEDAGADSVDAVAELEVAQHLELGEAYVDAVDVGDDVADARGSA